jgi:hypothetical protein
MSDAANEKTSPADADIVNLDDSDAEAHLKIFNLIGQGLLNEDELEQVAKDSLSYKELLGKLNNRKS